MAVVVALLLHWVLGVSYSCIIEERTELLLGLPVFKEPRLTLLYIILVVLHIRGTTTNTCCILPLNELLVVLADDLPAAGNINPDLLNLTQDLWSLVFRVFLFLLVPDVAPEDSEDIDLGVQPDLSHLSATNDRRVPELWRVVVLKVTELLHEARDLEENGEDVLGCRPVVHDKGLDAFVVFNYWIEALFF